MKRKLIVAVLAASCLVPLSARAQQTQGSGGGTAASTPNIEPVSTNEVTVGGGYVSSKSFLFGRFTGLVDPGFAIGDFTYRGRDPWDSGGTNYWDIEGTNLGLTSRSISATVGQQGTWGLQLYYDGIPYYFSDSFHSVYNNDGSLVAGVAKGSVAAATSLTGKLNVLDAKTQRDIYGGKFHYQIGDWVFSTDIKQEHKEGTKENSFTFGSTPVSPSFGAISTAAIASFAEPVNYDTGIYRVMGQYNGQRVQGLLSYNLSVFNDNITAFHAQNPFALSTASYGPGVAGVSAWWSTPPSNTAHQIKAEAGLNLTPTTRLNANFAYGLQMQNDAFAPSTGNANVVGTSVPRSSFDGLVNTIFGNLAITSEPLDRVNVRASYTIDDRDNMSPRNTYTTSVGDTTTLATNSNLPYSYIHQIGTLEGGYRFLPETKLTLDYRFDDTTRNYADTKQVIENTGLVKVRSNLWENVFGSLQYSHAVRDAGHYDQTAPWSFINMGANEDFNGLFKFFEASRTRDEVKGMLNYSPSHSVTGSFMVKYDNDDYTRSTLGLRNNENISLGPDATWEPTEGLSLHAYYTYQRVYYNQNDVYWTTTTCNSNGFTLTAACNGEWNGKTTDQVHTVGFDAEWKAIPDKLKFKLTYNLSYGDTGFVISDGGVLALGGVTNSSLLTAPLPDVVSLLNSLTLKAEYNIRPDITLFAGDTLERFDYQDFSQTSATIYSTGILAGDANPSYFVNIFFAGMRYRF